MSEDLTVLIVFISLIVLILSFVKLYKKKDLK